MTGIALRQRVNVVEFGGTAKSWKTKVCGKDAPFGLMKLVLTKIALYANAANLGMRLLRNEASRKASIYIYIYVVISVLNGGEYCNNNNIASKMMIYHRIVDEWKIILRKNYKIKGYHSFTFKYSRFPFLLSPK